jgi:hypothetical protein
LLTEYNVSTTDPDYRVISFHANLVFVRIVLPSIVKLYTGSQTSWKFDDKQIVSKPAQDSNTTRSHRAEI